MVGSYGQTTRLVLFVSHKKVNTQFRLTSPCKWYDERWGWNRHLVTTVAFFCSWQKLKLWHYLHIHRQRRPSPLQKIPLFVILLFWKLKWYEYLQIWRSFGNTAYTMAHVCTWRIVCKQANMWAKNRKYYLNTTFVVFFAMCLFW